MLEILVLILFFGAFFGITFYVVRYMISRKSSRELFYEKSIKHLLTPKEIQDFIHEHKKFMAAFVVYKNLQNEPKEELEILEEMVRENRSNKN